jgi:hypothetical protein
VLAFLLVARMRRARWCCFSTMRAMESCELPERPVGMGRTPGGGQRPPGGSGLLRPGAGGGEPVHLSENVYLPLAMHMESRHSGLAALEAVRGTTPDTEPPPAYHDLFPAGYKFSPDKIEEEEGEEEEASQGLVLSSLKEEGAEAVEVSDSSNQPAGGSGTDQVILHVQGDDPVSELPQRPPDSTSR